MQLYYPCVMDSRGRIILPLCPAKSKEEAAKLLKEKRRGAWLRHEAIPQPKEYIDGTKEA